MSRERKLLDHWSPPPGVGDPIACLATSFTFDQDFFETQALARFLGLDSQRGDDADWICIVEEEERLSQVRVTVLIDRGESSGKRNLRWDLLTGGAPGRLMHAKVTILVWERLVRFIVSSANLTPAGYRNQVECAAVLDVHQGASIPGPVARDLSRAVRRLVRAAPGREAGTGPKERALASLDRIDQMVARFRLPRSAQRGEPVIGVATAGFGGRPLSSLQDVWRGSSIPRSATVLSPFFDEHPAGSPTATALVGLLAQRGECDLRFVVPVNVGAERVAVRAPKALAAAIPERIETSFEAFVPETDQEPRRLHAKAVVLESADWIAALVGSSNFTTKGMGLVSRPHFEIDLAFGAQAGSAAGGELLELIPAGEPLDAEEVEWDPQDDEDEEDRPVLPWGFEECLLDPGPPSTLLLRFDRANLPKSWTIQTPSGAALLDQANWLAAGEPEELEQPLAEEGVLFLEVSWGHGADHWTTTWPVNVTEPSRLPPPEELRHISVEALLRILASTRPIHEAAWIELGKKGRPTAPGTLPPELDPLRRYSETGQLLKRARRVSEALAGLRRRLERPAANLDALDWRLRGPFGPIALAHKLLDEDATAGMVAGEPAFLLAELALTLSRVDWARTATVVSRPEVNRRVRAVLVELSELRTNLTIDPWLAGYIDDAFEKATP